MVRSPVTLRRAVPGDADALAALHQRLFPAQAAPGLRGRLATALARHDVEVQLAVSTAPGTGPGGPQAGGRTNGPVVGVLVLRLAEVVAMSPGGAVHVEQLWVDPDWRRRGVARSLLAAAARTAERLGVDDIACSVPPAGRDVHRFLARLGFGPAVTLRTVPVGRLQRRLFGAAGAPGSSGRRRAVLDQLVARRRAQMLTDRALTGVERHAAGT